MKPLRTMNIPIFIPHIGCPNDCVFCNQRKISGSLVKPEVNQVEKIVEEWLGSAGEKDAIEIAFFGGSFTGLEQEEMIAYLETASKLVNKHQLKGIRMSTRPDYINQEILSILEKYPVTAIELGVQSMVTEVLKRSKRNHSVSDVVNAVNWIQTTDIELGLQMMVGLPGSTYEMEIYTAQKLIEFKPKTIRIYPTLIIEDTELKDMYIRGEYKPLTLQEGVDIVSEILPMFIKERVSVLKVGLHANDLLADSDKTFGPYHPAFKELVEDEIVYKRIIREVFKLSPIDTQTARDNSNIGINKMSAMANQRLYQRLVGHKQNNKKRLKEMGIDIFQSQDLNKDEILLKWKDGSTVLTMLL